MPNTADKVISIALDEVGYLEKASNNNLYSKTANAGYNNYTKYGKEMHDIYPAVMDFPAAWCDAFVDWCFYKAYGVANAKALLGGNFDDYTVNSAQLYKNKNAWYTSDPMYGDQIFFKNSVRICHTGLVYAVDVQKVYTVEGNTSAGAGVIPNGGGVFKKSYLLGDPCIAGYGRPKYDVAGLEYKPGWNHDNNGWWYADSKTTYLKSTWAVINGHRYYFNSDGYAVTNWQQINGEWYYFEPIAGHPLECALYVTDSEGRQKPGVF